MLIQFVFPENNESIKEVKNREHARFILQSQFKSLQIQDVKGSLYTFINGQRRLTAYCKTKGCLSKIYWKRDDSQQVFKLSKMESNHKHKIKQRKKESIIQYIKGFPLNEQNQIDMKSLIMNKFKCSSTTYYKSIRQISNPTQYFNISSMIKALIEKGWKINYEPFNFRRIPNFLILTCQEMLTKYYQFGYSICIDSSYNMCKQTPENPTSLNQQIIVTTICGRSPGQKLLVFAIALCAGQTYLNMLKVLQSFFMITQDGCDSICSDQSPSIGSAVQQLKRLSIFDGIHTLDPFHIINNISKKIKDKDKISYFTKLWRAIDQYEYQQIYENLVEILDETELKQLEKFQSISQRFCFSKLPKNYFYGVTVGLTISEKINDIMKKFVPRSLSYGQLLQRLISVSHHINSNSQLVQYQKAPIQDIFGLTQLKLCRIYIPKQTLRYLTKIIGKSLSIVVNHQSDTQFYVKYHENTIKLKLNSNNLIECECQQTFMMGLPCAHSIKVIFQKRLSLFRHVHNYYKTKRFQNKELKEKAKGPGKKTRKNKKK